MTHFQETLPMNAPDSPSHLTPEIHQREVPVALVDAL